MATSSPTIAPTGAPSYPGAYTIAGEAYQSVDAFTPFVWQYLIIGMWAYMLFRMAYLRTVNEYTAAWTNIQNKLYERGWAFDYFAAQAATGAIWSLTIIYFLFATVLFFTYNDQWKEGRRQWRQTLIGVSLLLWPVGQIFWHEAVANPWRSSPSWQWTGQAVGHLTSLTFSVIMAVMSTIILTDNASGRDANNLGSIAVCVLGYLLILIWVTGPMWINFYVGMGALGVTLGGGRDSAKIRNKGGADGAGKYAVTNDDETGTSRKKGSRRALESAEADYGY